MTDANTIVREVEAFYRAFIDGFNRIARYKKDGSVLEKGRYCYTLRKDGTTWKILTLTEVKPPFAGPGERPR